MLDLYYLAVAALDRRATPRSRRADTKAEDAFYQNFRESPLHRFKKAIAQIGTRWRKVGDLSSEQQQAKLEKVRTSTASHSASPQVAASGCQAAKPRKVQSAQALAACRQEQTA